LLLPELAPFHLLAFANNRMVAEAS